MAMCASSIEIAEAVDSSLGNASMRPLRVKMVLPPVVASNVVASRMRQWTGSVKARLLGTAKLTTI